ncbi:MAG: class I SAM-dependent methyltransferase [Candidatus Levybacteria bacterium]|nr:class I SAM-dependent methyltransferase [Candidatus Levybacteria bacterium]MSU26089.1 class I SAM-dependent methyltransferase [Candidatus Levybacteria bacterium]
MQTPKKMSFAQNVDKTEAKGEHKFYFSFSEKYIKDKVVLDLGSWTGPYAVLIYNLAKEITAVDAEEKALKVLKNELPRVKCVEALSHKLPFDQKFDVVTFWDVIEHIPIGYELATIQEINRVTNKNGYLFLATVQKNFWSDLLDPAYWLAGHRHYSDEQLVGMLEDSGYKVEEITHVGSFISSFYALSFYFFKHILRMKMPVMPYFEKMMEDDIASPGYIQVAIRAKKIS